MSTLAAQTYLTPAEYLNMERKAVTKNEYLSGQIKEYILISQSRMFMEHHLRQESQWRATEFQELDDIVSITSIKCELLLRHIYRGVTFSD